MPIVLIGCWLAPMIFAMPLAISEMEKEKKVNEICTKCYLKAKSILAELKAENK